MNEERFNKGIKDWKETKLSDLEKAKMLESVFNAPIETPYMRYVRVFSYIRIPASGIVALILIVGLSSVAFASQGSLPGDKLYPMKVGVVEPIVGAFKFTPEQKLGWAETKVQTRIAEAEALASKNKLDATTTSEIERNIIRSSSAFARAADDAARTDATSTDDREEKVKKLKEGFVQRISSVSSGENDAQAEAKSEDSISEATSTDEGGESAQEHQSFQTEIKFESGSRSDEIKRLRESAIQAIQDPDHGDRRDRKDRRDREDD